MPDLSDPLRDFAADLASRDDASRRRGPDGVSAGARRASPGTGIAGGDCVMPSTTPPEGGSPGRDRTAAQGTGEGPAEIRVPDPIHETATIAGGGAGLAPPYRPRADDGAAAPVGLGEFRRALVDIEVVVADELEIVAAGVPESEGVLGLARALQRAGRLTAYQAAALYQRKSRGLLIGNYLILEKLG